jgi:hypothetical protein
LRRWPAMFGVPILRIVSSFSLLLLVACSWAVDYVKLRQQLDGAKTPESQSKVLHSWSLQDDPDLESAVYVALDSYDSEEWRAQVSRVRELLDLRVVATQARPQPKAKAEAAAIKNNPLYRDAGLSETSNWIDNAIRAFLKLLPEFKQPKISGPRGGLLPTWIVPLMWTLLGAAVLTFGYFAFRHFSWKRTVKRRAKAVLEEDEPERTLDEWLELADSLTSQGRYREAVRALYLSCLLKFDEHGVARFIRGETNWEHLSRIRASSRRPTDIDFLPPTQAFDRVWYGQHVRGIEDVEQFRGWYQQITESLRGVKAA